MKKITITACPQCPHYKTGGGFAAVARKPRCSRTEKSLPYDVGLGFSGNAIAKPTNQIPGWCPLDDDAQEAIEVLPWSSAGESGEKPGNSADGVMVHHKPTGIMITANRYNHADLNREEALRELDALLSNLKRESN